MEKNDEPINNPEMEKLTSRAKKLNKERVDWHHHHLHPNCIFNLKGHHVAVLEDPQSKDVLTAIIDKNPVLQLKEIEKLFYKK